MEWVPPHGSEADDIAGTDARRVGCFGIVIVGTPFLAPQGAAIHGRSPRAGCRPTTGDEGRGALCRITGDFGWRVALSFSR